MATTGCSFLPAQAGNDAAWSGGLFAGHHPDTVPFPFRRIFLQLSTAIYVGLGEFIGWIERERILEGLYRSIPFSGAVEIEAAPELVERLHHVGECFLGMVVENLDHADRLRFAFDHHLVDLAAAIGAAQLGHGELADQDMRIILLAGAFEPGR